MTNDPWHWSGVSLMCPQCSVREGEQPGTLTPPTTNPLEQIRCSRCEHEFTRLDALVHPNEFVRWAAIATHVETGDVHLRRGDHTQVSLTSLFDIVGPLVVTPHAYVMSSALLTSPTAVDIYTSRTPGLPDDQPIQIVWLVYGIEGADKVPGWWLQLFAAMQSAAEWRAKLAIIDYAGAFEVFIETVLNDALTVKYDAAVSAHILKRTPEVAERVKTVLDLAIGRRLTEDQDIHRAWLTRVKDVRNGLVHSGGLPLTPSAAADAHQATIAAMQWIADRLP